MRRAVSTSERLADQVRQALENICTVLAQAQAGPEHIVRLTWYITSRDEYYAELADIGAAYRAVMGKNFPAMSVVQVVALMERRRRLKSRPPPSYPTGHSSMWRPHPDAAAIASREAGLHKDLSRAQLVMIGLGGAIGTGLFMGSGLAIGYAGPAVILSYAIAAVAAVAMVFSLSEMAVVHPTAGSFGTYAEIYLNLVGGHGRALLLLDGTGDRRRRRGGGGRRVHDLLVPRHAGVAVVAGIRFRTALLQLTLCPSFRLDRILARPHQGGRHRASSSCWGCRTIFGIWTTPLGFAQSHRPSRRIHAAWIRRRVDGCDHRAYCPSTASK